ncbi:MULTISPECIES: Fe-S cluster assembly protein SufD [unclassified Rhizobium]|uniref:Fe-S cluster assembly protein SufD n=1 Tax=unclassified Rhizobium TaxID=2613769 RepID=UPI001AE6EE5E|nr:MULTISPECIES: Fe-S cluster assembly protein SufD [unclassified Rhizobium]MBP2461238.1 Fe-S cluster assembly protein SufD [Rhizobium sp. PvP014]MBP2528634.1 Fe-S cluster assembly protein SufD [Rhizobium sp. PvP099]
MNMQMNQPVRLTAAETALVEAFAAQVGELPGNGAVTGTRDRLLDDLKQSGLPTRRIESWHYTDLKNLLRSVPERVAGGVSVQPVAPLVEGAKILSIVQGVADNRATIDGVELSVFRDQLADGSAVAGLAAFDKDDAIGRINGSFVRDGFALSVPADVSVEQPIELQAVHGAGQVHTRFPAVFGARSKATIIERHCAVTEDAALVSSISDLTLQDGAEITWIILQTQGADDTHLGQIRISLGTDTKLRLFIVNAGGKLVRQELRVDVQGEGSEFTLRAVNLLGGDTHTDVTMVLGHNVPHTSSTEIIRNVLFDKASGVFQGMIKVAPDAQKTDAKMACNTLLMSDDADFSVKPELEIFADDVICGHGATVSDIDRNHLFYLMARGVPENRARAMLVNAFVAEIVEELEEEKLVEALEGVISDWLEKHA